MYNSKNTYCFCVKPYVDINDEIILQRTKRHGVKLSFIPDACDLIPLYQLTHISNKRMIANKMLTSPNLLFGTWLTH